MILGGDLRGERWIADLRKRLGNPAMKPRPPVRIDLLVYRSTDDGVDEAVPRWVKPDDAYQTRAKGLVQARQELFIGEAGNRLQDREIEPCGERRSRPEKLARF